MPIKHMNTLCGQNLLCLMFSLVVDSSWNVMAHSDPREGKWRGNWRMEWVASTLHTTSERGISSITTADAHTLAASSRLNCRPRRFKWTRPFRRKTKSGFCACAIITFSTGYYIQQPLGLKDLKWQHGIRGPNLRSLNNCQAQIQAYGCDASTEITSQRVVRQV